MIAQFYLACITTTPIPCDWVRSEGKWTASSEDTHITCHRWPTSSVIVFKDSIPAWVISSGVFSCVFSGIANVKSDFLTGPYLLRIKNDSFQQGFSTFSGPRTPKGTSLSMYLKILEKILHHRRNPHLELTWQLGLLRQHMQSVAKSPIPLQQTRADFVTESLMETASGTRGVPQVQNPGFRRFLSLFLVDPNKSDAHHFCSVQKHQTDSKNGRVFCLIPPQ